MSKDQTVVNGEQLTEIMRTLENMQQEVKAVREQNKLLLEQNKGLLTNTQTIRMTSTPLLDQAKVQKKFWKALDAGNLPLIEELLDSGADVNAASSDKGCSTPLQLASGAGNLEVVKLLLEFGADIEGVNKIGSTAVLCAAQKDQIEISKLLVVSGADVKVVNEKGVTALHYASERNNFKAVKFFVESGVDVNAVNIYGYTALHHASAKNNFDAVQFLVESGANVNAVNKADHTALSFSGYYSDTFQYLKKAIEIKNNPQEGLGNAIEGIDKEGVKLAILFGADVLKNIKVGGVSMFGKRIGGDEVNPFKFVKDMQFKAEKDEDKGKKVTTKEIADLIVKALEKTTPAPDKTRSYKINSTWQDRYPSKNNGGNDGLQGLRDALDPLKLEPVYIPNAQEKSKWRNSIGRKNDSDIELMPLFRG
jgi:hypothetical protein